MLLILDGDSLVYRSGFAAESISYRVIAIGADGNAIDIWFDPEQGKSANDKFKEWVAANPDAEILDKEKHVKAEPVSHALEIARSTLESISAAVSSNFRFPVERKLILSGAENWRNKVATLLPYKGNRDPSHKPVHYKALREYKAEAHGAIITDGIEADDLCAMLAYEERQRPAYCAEDYCVASIDKDLDQVPGWHYDFGKRVFYYIDAEDAARSFWQQVLSGDSTDNIGGVWKLGSKGAKQHVEGWYAEGYNARQIWQTIVTLYAHSQTKSTCPYADKDPADVALENARLLYLQQKPDELWNPPGVPRGKVSELAG